MIACPVKREKTYVFDLINIVLVLLETCMFHENDLSKLVQDKEIDIILVAQIPMFKNSNT